MNPPTSVVAVDVGGTGIKGARFDEHGQVQESLRRATPVAEGPDAVVAAVRETVTALVRADTGAVGLCSAGLLDTATGIVRYAPNLGMRETPLVSAVQQCVTAPVVLQHDVRAACLAERRLGMGRGVGDLLVVVLGTGIAAGIVIAGHPVVGACGIAGEFGHIPVFADGELCPCGQRGCVEAYASAGALVRRYQQAGGDVDNAAALRSLIGQDAVAAQVWADGADALGRALVASTVLLDHEKVVLAGGLAEAGEVLLTPVRSALRRGLVWRQPPEVVISPLGSRAGLLGTALEAMEAVGLPATADAWNAAAVRR